MAHTYKTIDLFAGIGGIRLGFEQTGRIRNVFSSEINRFARMTYQDNFGEDPLCDITKIDEKKIPDCDILLAGFPCQPFSIAGNRAGFNDTRGTLFFDVARIIKEKQPQAFLLENVKGLTHHDKGRTFQVIIDTLRNDLGYTVYTQVLNAKDYGIPQHRERIYIVGFKKKIGFEFPKPIKLGKKVKNILEKNKVSSKYYLLSSSFNMLKKHRAEQEAKGNGFGYKILSPSGICNTLVVGGWGERNLIIDKRLTVPDTETNKEFIRKLTPRELARFQGFPDTFKIPVSDTQAYRQFGNSVCVPVINAIAKIIIQSLDNIKKPIASKVNNIDDIKNYNRLARRIIQYDSYYALIANLPDRQIDKMAGIMAATLGNMPNINGEVIEKHYTKVVRKGIIEYTDAYLPIYLEIQY